MSLLGCEFMLASPSELYGHVLVVRFHGAQRAGAEGAADARFMQAHVALGMDLWNPEGLVLDLALLTCANVPALRAAMTPVEPNLEEGFPFFVVAPPGGRAALEQAFPEPALVEALDDALARIGRAGPWALR